MCEETKHTHTRTRALVLKRVTRTHPGLEVANTNVHTYIGKPYLLCILFDKACLLHLFANLLSANAETNIIVKRNEANVAQKTWKVPRKEAGDEETMRNGREGVFFPAANWKLASRNVLHNEWRAVSHMWVLRWWRHSERVSESSLSELQWLACDNLTPLKGCERRKEKKGGQL